MYKLLAVATEESGGGGDPWSWIYWWLAMGPFF